MWRSRADRNARGDHILWLHPGRAPATGPGLAAAVQALQELQARPYPGRLHPRRPQGSCWKDRCALRLFNGFAAIAQLCWRMRGRVGSAVSVIIHQSAQDDLGEAMALRQRAAEYQLALYPGGGTQYVRHRDAFPDDGSEEQQRRVRAWVVPGLAGSGGDY